jgi:hypothetical protein
MRAKERELHDKYGPDRNRILDLIQSDMEPVARTFRNESTDKADQPEITRYEGGIRLKLPLVHESMHIGLALSFDLVLTGTGCAANVKSDFYDHKTEQVYCALGRIPPQVEKEAVRKEIRKFIESRNQTAKLLQEESNRFRREHET